MSSELHVISWSINGSFTAKIPLIKTFFHSANVLCLQEHFITTVGENLLKLDSSLVTYSRGARSSGADRPSGGIAVYVKNHLDPGLFRHSDYFVAVKIKNLVIASVYLPNDYSNDRSEVLFD